MNGIIFNIKNNFQIIILVLLFAACNGHNKTTVILSGFNKQKIVIYQTEKADFYISYDDLINYFKIEDNGEPNDFTYKQIIQYLENYSNNPILLPDTLGTKLEKSRDIYPSTIYNEICGESIIRVRDQNHPYAYITDDVRWSLLEFAKKGNLKIYLNQTQTFLDTIIIDKVETDAYGETNILMTNDSIIFSQLRWIR